MAFSNSFHNLTPKVYKTILHKKSQTFLNYPNHFYTFFSLIHLHKEPVLLFVIATSFHLQIGTSTLASIFPLDWVDFPKCGKIGSCRANFFNLVKNSRLGMGFGNSWRCSHIECLPTRKVV